MTILVAVDDSRFASHAVAHAQVLAERAGLPLRLLRVIDPASEIPGGPDRGEDVTAGVRADREATLQHMLDELGATGEVATELLGPGERVHETVVRVARDQEARLVALGSHGAGFLRHTVLGSAAMGVVSHSPVPVMVAGPKAEPRPKVDGTYTIMVADDLDPPGRDLLDGLKPLTVSGEVRVRIVFLYEERLGDRGEVAELRAAQATLQSLTDTFPETARVEYDALRLPDFERLDGSILRVARESGATAIGMATHGHSRGRHLLAGSSAVGVLKHARVPVILARHERGKWGPRTQR